MPSSCLSTCGASQTDLNEPGPGFVGCGHDAVRLLVERCQEGNTEAWNQLIFCCYRTIYQYAFSLCHNHDDAGDICGLVLLRVYQNIHTFRHQARFTSWLYRIVQNAHHDLCLRPAARRLVTVTDRPLPMGGLENTGCSEDDPQQLLLDKERRNALVRAVACLPPRHRIALQLFHQEGQSYAEIADRTGVSVGTVKSRLNRARSLLRERLKPVLRNPPQSL